MSYKPDESILVAYLYNELGKDERSKVELYLQQHPGKRKELDDIAKIRNVMGKWNDKEVMEPSFVFSQDKVIFIGADFWKSSIVRIAMSVAASIVLIMVVGYATNVRIAKNSAGVQISFGNAQETLAQPITQEHVKTWIEESLSANNEQLLDKISEVENNISNEFIAYQNENRHALKNAKINQVDESLVQAYVAQLKDENKNIIVDLMLASENTQRQYVNEILSDFSMYLEEQRQADLEVIQTSFNNLKNNTEVSQIETNQLLASIITTVNNQNN